MLTDFILSPEFNAFATVASLFGDAAAVFLATYTFYLTVLSNNLVYVSSSFQGSKFYGTVLAVSLQNKTLHAIPIQSVFIMKKIGDKFYYIKFNDFSDPIVIDSWRVKRIETKPFTFINGVTNKFVQGGLNGIINNSVIGVKTGNDLLWIKQNKNAPLKEAQKAYKERRFEILTVHSKKRDNKVISEAVDCVIYLKMTDMNGQIVLKKVFGITGYNSGTCVLLSETICGYNMLNGAGNTPDSITHFIETQLGIKKENICVDMIDNI